MPKLLIYIPTFNRYLKLKLCLERVFAEIAGHENDVRIHVSDNHSDDETLEYLKSQANDILTFTRNSHNIGGAKNILGAHRFKHLADFTLILGDDDYLLGRSIGILLSAIKNNPDVDLFFINSIAYEESRSGDILKFMNQCDWKMLPNGGSTKSCVIDNFRCSFKDLINPKIDEVFGGSLMCYVFRSRLVNDLISEKIDGVKFGGIYSSYPHTLNFINSLSPECSAAHLAQPFTLNFWHKGAEWGYQTYDLIVTQGLGFLFFELCRLGFVEKSNQEIFFNHYIYIAKPSLEKLLDLNNRSDMILFDPIYMTQLLAFLVKYKI